MRVDNPLTELPPLDGRRKSIAAVDLWPRRYAPFVPKAQLMDVGSGNSYLAQYLVDHLTNEGSIVVSYF
jgi:hypothetical protein